WRTLTRPQVEEVEVATGDFDNVSLAIIRPGQFVSVEDPPQPALPGRDFLRGSRQPMSVSDATFELSLSSEGMVAVGLFNVSGRQVARIASGRFGVGQHRIRWDGNGLSGSHVAPGVYFLRLEESSRRIELARSLVLLP
ncbi:MAG: FlgD immunoglobulin-like domain containing protein, partial [Candidatus Eisenbacteria bacterium]